MITTLNEEAKKELHGLLNLASHELLTPVSALKGLLYLMKEEHRQDEETKQRFMLLLEQSTDRIHRMIKRVLMYDCIKNNIPIDKPGIAKLNNLLCLQVLRKHVSEINRINDLFYDLELPADISLSIPQDYFLLIVEELVCNAFKFTPIGKKVTVNIKTDSSQKYAIIEIIDQGIGLSVEEINNINPYTQFNRKKQEQQGIGLGLYLVKTLVSMYSGKINITSATEQGTTVIVELPIVNITDSNPD